ncbi:MAG: diguanylate cyclase [Alphaproteobacteria bacterium]|nr:diguanylate cyclase [Alphaproteobacteria bacterium]
MTIANRVGALVAAALLLLLAVDALVLGKIVLPRFAALEEQDAREDMRRVQAEFDDQLVQLDRFATDWAAWDDVYQFAKDRNQAFLQSNLETKVMLEQHISLMWLIDTQGKTIWGRALDPDQPMPKPHGAFPGQHLPLDHPLIGLKETDVGRTGFIATPLGAMLVASRPIVTSHFEGPVRGFLIVGKLLNEHRLTAMSQRIGVELRGSDLAQLESGSPRSRLLSLQAPGEVRLSVDEGRNRITASASVYDLRGSPIFLLTTDRNRTIIMQGRDTLQIALIVLAVSGVFLMGLVYLLLRIKVTKPLIDLAKDIQTTGSGTLSAPRGSGELADVTREVGGMLERINHLAHMDSLTDLPNRTFFAERAEHALTLAKRNRTHVAVLLLDLDGFKEVNVTLGHQAGDRLLVAIAGMLKSVLRESDTLARFGGDEFLVLAENLPLVTGPAELAKRLLAVFKQPLPPEDIRHGRSCSIGIAVYPDDGITVDDLLRKADIAMYRAKSAGGNTWRCHAETLNCLPNQQEGQAPQES